MALINLNGRNDAAFSMIIKFIYYLSFKNDNIFSSLDLIFHRAKFHETSNFFWNLASLKILTT